MFNDWIKDIVYNTLDSSIPKEMTLKLFKEFNTLMPQAKTVYESNNFKMKKDSREERERTGYVEALLELGFLKKKWWWIERTEKEYIETQEGRYILIDFLNYWKKSEK